MKLPDQQFHQMKQQIPAIWSGLTDLGLTLFVYAFQNSYK